MEIPVISIVIPLFNAKEYIGECLDSVLAQTFQKFEVIVVDDCSKDGSVETVESYVPKFDGRLRVMKTKKNSGGGGYIPRNIGLNLANGEYIFFLDADDYLAQNALETLYEAATKNNADVVYTAAYYELNEEKKFHVLRDEKGKRLQRKGGEDAADLVTDDPEKNLNELFMEGTFQTPWTKFVRRDFLTDNELFFPEIVTGGDYIWSINVFSKAKRFLRLPVPIYFFRSYSLSFALRKERRPQKQVSFWVKAFVSWLKALNALVTQNELLAKNPAWCYKASSDYFKYCLGWMSDEVLNRFYSKDTYEILLREFAKGKDSAALMVPFFFSALTSREKNAAKTQKRVDKLEEEISQQKKQIGSLTTQAEHVKELEGEVAKQKKQIDTLTPQAGRAKELEGEVAKQKKQIDTLTPQAGRAKELEGEVAKQKKQIDTLTPQANRAKELEGEVAKQKKQIDTLTPQANRAKELEGEVAKQKKQIDKLSARPAEVAVSIIIPMYNAEKYIGEALDSILDQTLQNFEVIVVDDCSKDSSYKVVESYIPKFDGRLRLSRMAKNSGSAPAPRNKGFLFARGEYMFFMDVDDVLTKTGLEEMYTLAKEYDADCVYCEKYYMSSGEGKDFIEKARIANTKIQKPPFVDKPTLISDDLGERLQELSERKFWVTPWQRLVSRELLAENRITFPEIIGCDDVIWCFQVLCCSKRFLRVPNACYIRRMSDESFTQSSKKSANKHIHQWMDRPVRGLKFADNFMNRVDFFNDNPAYRYLVYDWLSVPSFNMILNVCKNLEPDAIYEIFFKEFAKDTGENAVLVSYLCTRICEQNKLLMELSHELPQQSDLNFAVGANDKQRADKAETKLSHENKWALSIVVSLYNYEKYIGECLDSLLNQTFKDFEVIVVDDRSTDNSFKIAKSYEPKFDGRLQVTRTETNSGGGGIPRNIGLRLARGEYVFFMDADDVFTKTGLEEMYTLAKKYDADCVYCEKYYMSSGVGKDFVKNIHIAEDKIQKPPFVDKPTLETGDFVERTKKSTHGGYWVTAWLRLVQRKLLIENGIRFDSLIASNDVGWTFKVLFCSKRFLRVPNACYIRRIHDESVTFRQRTPAQYVHKWMDIAVRTLKSMDDFLGEIKFFQENLQCRFEVLEYLLQSALANTFRDCQGLSKTEIYNSFREAFGEYLGKNDVLAACLFTRTIGFRKWSEDKYDRMEKSSQQRIAELEEEISRLKKENQQLTTNASFKFANPAVSVVIPMYNAEEYISDCLDSLLIQTFQNFEVIVVDDCSTDNSVKIVESYAPKFNGRLRISATEKNSGGGGYIPRNIGLNFAGGEYVIFLDSDDFLLGTALETLYNAAKEHDAEVVYFSIYYDVKNPNDVYLHRDGLARQWLKDGIKDQTRLTVDDRHKLFQEFALPGTGEGNFRAPWSKFVRRDYLLKNKITFPDIITGGDCVWCINVYAYAKRFLRLPVPLYFYRRYNGTSITRITRNPEEQLSYWIEAFVAFLKAVNDLQNRTEFLRENPSYCYEAVKGGHFEWCLNRTYEARTQLSNQEIYQILYREFSKYKDLSGFTVPFFFSFIDAEKKNSKDNLDTIKSLREEVKQFKKAKK